MSKQLVKYNNNKALVNAGNMAFSGSKALVPVLVGAGLEYGLPLARQYGKEAISKWNQKRRNKEVQRVESSMVAHPGAFPGAIAAPVAISRRVFGNKPRFKNSKGVVNISHRELVATVLNTNGNLQINNGIVSNSTGNSPYTINPLSTQFTWLNSIASNFDEFTFTRVRFCYVPSCATTETGRVNLMWDKDSQDQVPADRFEMSSYQHTAEGAPWAENCLDIPCDSKRRFTFAGDVVDKKLVELGQFMFGVYGGSSTNSIGDIYVEYSVSLFEAQPANSILQFVNGSSTVVLGSSGIPYGFATVSSGVLSFFFTTGGTFLVSLQATGTGITASPIAGNATQVGLKFGGTGSGYILMLFALTVTGSPSNTPSFSVTVTGLGSWEYYITRINNTQYP